VQGGAEAERTGPDDHDIGFHQAILSHAARAPARPLGTPALWALTPA
jgi:hypothetical protein